MAMVSLQYNFYRSDAGLWAINAYGNYRLLYGTQGVETRITSTELSKFFSQQLLCKQALRRQWFAGVRGSEPRAAPYDNK
jgi:hypothetical protein